MRPAGFRRPARGGHAARVLMAEKKNAFLSMHFRFVQQALFLLVSLCAGQALAQTAVSGAITADTRWTLDGSPYLVSGNLVIQNGATLTIDAGVVIYMG